MFERVDPFIGCEATRLPNATEDDALAARWWWPKAQVGNTHPGACYPFGMVSACAYSGAYPSGYGLYDLNYDSTPPRMHEGYVASGFTHFHQSGVGKIRKYYNYLKVTPLLGGTEALTQLGDTWSLTDEQATPGYYSCRLAEPDIRAEMTVASRAAVHRYEFPESDASTIAIDLSHGGIHIQEGQTVPLSASLKQLTQFTAAGSVTMEGVPLYVYIELDARCKQCGLWVDKQPVTNQRQIDFDYIRPSTFKPFGFYFTKPTEAGEAIEVRLGFSWRSVEQAQANMEAMDVGGFEAVHQATTKVWQEHLGKIEVDLVEGAGPKLDDSIDAELDSKTSHETVFATAMYHSLIKPCDAKGESPFWPGDRAFVFDVCTLWDLYKTHIPLMMTLFPDRGSVFVNALLNIIELEGNFPVGYRMSRGYDRFAHQASALAHICLTDAYLRKLDDITWDRAVTYMAQDLRRGYGETFFDDQIVHPLVHTLDLAYGCYCTALLAKAEGDEELASNLVEPASWWQRAIDAETGLLLDSTYYEGTKYNYSFRLLHDMQQRIALAGGDEKFLQLLDRFFGYGSEPVEQMGEHASKEARKATSAAGYDLGRFEGLNNEPDMEAMYAYHYAGRPDRTAEIVRDVVRYQFTVGRGGLAGNEDSGALSSWYVWNTLGLFPVAGQPVVLIGSPVVHRGVMHLGSGDFTVVTENNSAKNIYVQSASLDGQPLERSWLQLDEFQGGHTLTLVMGDSPSDWGQSTEQRPPSFTV